MKDKMERRNEVDVKIDKDYVHLHVFKACDPIIHTEKRAKTFTK